MITATLNYKQNPIQVKILDTWKTPRGVRACVVALSGEPFDQMTHGGPAQTDSIVVNAWELQNVRIPVEKLQSATKIPVNV